MDHRKQRESPSPRSGKHSKGAKGGAGGGKKPIKVVYISNPMRVKTSAAGFRAVVQELTGRDAEPSKYSPKDDRDGAAEELNPEGSAIASTPDTGTGRVAAGDQRDVPAAEAAAFGEGGEDDGDEEDIFRSQLLDNNYSVFSPPTLLYDYSHSNKVQ